MVLSSSSAFVIATAAALSLWIPSRVDAHGLVSDPMSRAWFCGFLTKPFESNMKYPVCDKAFNAPGIDVNQAYNYMSMATHELGFQANGPKKTVCSYDSDFFNAKTWTDVAIDWPTNDVTSGERWFTWRIEWGPHFDDTLDFVTYITKPDFQFSPDKELSWDDFETEKPFCLEHYDDKNPTKNPNVVADKGGLVTFKVKCTLPERKGRHVIKQEWGRLPPTNERFHSCIDVVFPGSAPAVQQASQAPVAPSSSSSSSENCVKKGNQCGGSYYTGVTCCEAGSTCSVKSAYYSQCV